MFSFGREEKLFLIVNCAIANWLLSQAEQKPSPRGKEEEPKLDGHRARSLGAQEGVWECCCVSVPGRDARLA